MKARGCSLRSNANGRRDPTTHLAAALALGLLALPLLVAAAPLRLTNYAGNDMRPTWDPRPGSDIIAYQTNNGAAATNIFNLGAVQADGSNERLLARGPDTPFGIAAQNMSSWAGTSGRVIVNETVVFHEYMSFQPQPTTFTRTVGDGNDAAFTSELVIPGGGGGGFMLVSRDGSTAVWRWSTNGGSGTQQVRIGSFASLTGQTANSTGAVIAQLNSGSQYFLQGAAIAPNGSKVILAEPSGSGYDLFMYNFDGSGRIALTTSGLSAGISNVYPDFTPDGTHIAFARNAAAGLALDLWTMALDGSGLAQLTNTPETEAWPTWAPDGERFAYARSDLAVPGGPAANYNIYSDRFQAEPPPAVPEPGTLALLGLGLAGLAAVRRRRQ